MNFIKFGGSYNPCYDLTIYDSCLSTLFENFHLVHMNCM